jgi:hypothetical protein
MRNRKSIDALCIGVICVAAVIAALSAWHLPPKLDKGIYAQVGQVLAREAMAVTPPHGEIIVIARDTKAYRQPAMDITAEQIRAAAKALSVTTKLIQLDPLRPVEVPPGDFYEVIRRAKPGQVIVSLLGPPVLETEQRAKLGTTKPKIVALCNGSLAEQTDLRELFREGLLHAAIVNRQAPSGSTSPAGESFDQLYTVLRADGASNMASSIR